MSKKDKYGKRSITRAWLRNVLSMIAVILVIIEVVLIAIVRNYYYSSAKQYLTSKMNVVTSSVASASNDAERNYNSEVRSIVENYGEKDKIELMAVKADGTIDITSSGFSPDRDADLSDYEMAKESANGVDSQIFELPTGEKVIAVTSVLSLKGSEYDALRMVASMKNIDSQIIVITIIMTVVVIFIILFMFFSGKVFMKSIVYPTIQIGQVARKIAKGDFTQRVEKKKDDELGDLCDSINYMAEELANTESMKNEFISSISHELRTPLTAIKGWSETLTTIDDRDTFIKGMRVISSETERLSQMVEELLDFSRIQDNRLTLQMDTIDIIAELTETVLIYQERARFLGITLNYYEPEMVPFVYGDKNRLRQVFINIVDNAIKYSDKGDTVSVEAYEQNNEICISVSDTGMGISKEDLPKIKTKFFKANHTRRGSGIGLAVADEIISRHNGTLTINSEEGIGTTVMITLPCIEQNKKTDNQDTINVELISSDTLNERDNINE